MGNTDLDLGQSISLFSFLYTISTVLDPDPYSPYVSGSGFREGSFIRIHMDPDPKKLLLGIEIYACVKNVEISIVLGFAGRPGSGSAVGQQPLRGGFGYE